MVNGRVHKKTYTLINLKKPNLIKELKLEPLVDLRLLNDYIIDLLP